MRRNLNRSQCSTGSTDPFLVGESWSPSPGRKIPYVGMRLKAMSVPKGDPEHWICSNQPKIRNSELYRQWWHNRHWKHRHPPVSRSLLSRHFARSSKRYFQISMDARGDQIPWIRKSTWRIRTYWATLWYGQGETSWNHLSSLSWCLWRARALGTRSDSWGISISSWNFWASRSCFLPHSCVHGAPWAWSSHKLSTSQEILWQMWYAPGCTASPSGTLGETWQKLVPSVREHAEGVRQCCW